jgi:hypothetical protein
LRLEHPNWSVLAALVLANAHYVSATFVYASLWPRHAREEFVAGAGEALKTVRLLLGAEARAYVGEAVDPNRVVDFHPEKGNCCRSGDAYQAISQLA